VRTAVITIAAGRERHLARQHASLRSLSEPDHYVVVAMGDGQVARCHRLCGPGADVVGLRVDPVGLPLARARNTGADRALEQGAELLIFLDVDCLPGPRLPARYREAAEVAPSSLLSGPVGYLPPAAASGYRDEELAELARPHPARPIPPEDEVHHGGDHELFWTLSFAITAATWNRIGGFCEDYSGYGGEDTDFGQLAARSGVELCWVGGAWAYHQFHATHDPPVQHLDDILRNAAIFHRRWGWWPMSGWLDAFATLGLAQDRGEAGGWQRSAHGDERPLDDRATFVPTVPRGASSARARSVRRSRRTGS
jgi:hypothetical protein